MLMILSSRTGRRIAALACTITIGSGLAALGQGGQARPGRAAAATSPGPTPYIFGARHCAACHDQCNHPTYTTDERAGLICRMQEFPTFDTRDPHKLAYAALTGTRGQQMSKLLGTDVRQFNACVNCHSVRDHGIDKQQDTRETDGVTCVACHGPYLNWVEKHQATGSNEWRRLERNDKERDYGMTNLWDPVRRAEICASCHVGSDKDGKVITHAMYAAGHPPLPSFEAATFSDAQPRHAESLREKLLLPGRTQRLNPPRDANYLEQTQLVAAGSLVVLRESMRLFADRATGSNSLATGASWPDFARFDCYACHHDLPSAGSAPWRQTRGFLGAPGRPGVPEWPLVLARLYIEAASPERAPTRTGELNRHLDAFRRALAAQPFGDAQLAAQSAREVASWSESLLMELRGSPVSRVQARALLGRLCRIAQDRAPDYDSARQIAWAFRAIYNELQPGRPTSAPIPRRLAQLDAELLLTFPAATAKPSIEETLARRLRAVADYDPAAFKAQFAELEKDLAAMAGP
jgi:hypothetical protein